MSSKLDSALEDIRKTGIWQDVRVDRKRNLVTITVTEHTPLELVELGRLAFTYQPARWGAGKGDNNYVWFRW